MKGKNKEIIIAQPLDKLKKFCLYLPLLLVIMLAQHLAILPRRVELHMIMITIAQPI